MPSMESSFAHKDTTTMNESIALELISHPLTQELLLPAGALLGAVALGLVLRSLLLRLLGASARETETALQQAL
ncbi:MAG: hypothetical protein EA428_15940 [Spirochaetaceae bacterium]|nr:MAG: hypothetical protein EA428_15940 [Spirochaetaceae bacterium]